VFHGQRDAGLAWRLTTDGALKMADEESIRVFPVVAWQTATLPNGHVMLALSYLPGEPSKPLTIEQAHALAEVHRFGMSGAQCDELAQELQRVADRSRQRQSDERR
jgi:hypothetical protein